MSDRELAFSIYRHFCIVPSDWKAHYAQDCTRSHLRKNVRQVYRMIYASIAGGEK